METKSISHISRQVSLEPFVTGMSVVRTTVRISVFDDFEVPLTTLYDCVDTQENHIGSQGKTDIDTDTDRHRHTVRWVLLNNPSCLMHRLHIVIVHPLVTLDFFFWVGIHKLVCPVQPKRTQVETQYWGNPEVAQLEGLP